MEKQYEHADFSNAFHRSLPVPNAARQGGFTLIEIMVVIVIIGILALIAVPQYNVFSQRAEFTELVSAASPLRTSVEIAIQTRGPADLEALDGGADAAMGIPATVVAAAGDARQPSSKWRYCHDVACRWVASCGNHLYLDAQWHCSAGCLDSGRHLRGSKFLLMQTPRHTSSELAKCAGVAYT